jgi:putative transposase
MAKLGTAPGSRTVEADRYDAVSLSYRDSRSSLTGPIMPRRPRPVLAEIPLHIIQRGNNRARCFFADVDYLVYLDLLKRCAADAHCEVHAYVLMGNHVHLLVTPQTRASPAALMKALGQRYSQYVNRRYRRTGSLWEGRYKSSLVDHARYLLVCHRYIELNPVRAQMVSHPSDYPWSSYRTNADGHPSELIKPHLVYSALGSHPAAREQAYRQLFEIPLADETVQQVRRAACGNFVLGDAGFAAVMAQSLGREVIPRASGRRTKNWIVDTHGNA